MLTCYVNKGAAFWGSRDFPMTLKCQQILLLHYARILDNVRENKLSSSVRHLDIFNQGLINANWFCSAGSPSDSHPDPRLRWLEPPAGGRDLWVPNPQRGVCFVELVI